MNLLSQLALMFQSNQTWFHLKTRQQEEVVATQAQEEVAKAVALTESDLDVQMNKSP